MYARLIATPPALPALLARPLNMKLTSALQIRIVSAQTALPLVVITSILSAPAPFRLPLITHRVFPALWQAIAARINILLVSVQAAALQFASFAQIRALAVSIQLFAPHAFLVSISLEATVCPPALHQPTRSMVFAHRVTNLVPAAQEQAPIAYLALLAACCIKAAAFPSVQRAISFLRIDQPVFHATLARWALSSRAVVTP